MNAFVEKTLRSFESAAEYAASAELLASGRGWLQHVDPRVKVAGLFGLVIVVAAAGQLRAIAAIFGIALLLAIGSRIPLAKLAGWIWIPVLFFTGLIALPAIFVTPGNAVLTAGGFAITRQGLRAAAFLLSRAGTAATLSALLVLTTSWPRVLRALRSFRVPLVAVVILGMTYRYIFVILRTAVEMLESRKSRTVGHLEPADRRRLAAASAGVLLSKSLQLSGDVHLAMLSRGFRGEVYSLDDFQARAVDWCWLAGFAALAFAMLWWQH
ncbi:MAG TPA: cobalt ECF transporter T component CbiQ [Bryobacteraceae bacterium]|jgi:cobalt ECF transporter T component CbiQ|nr:cobalt ECF transporter T component CbiQ [Bryobacteraceae bacterium]